MKKDSINSANNHSNGLGKKVFPTTSVRLRLKSNYYNLPSKPHNSQEQKGSTRKEGSEPRRRNERERERERGE